jgi:integrase
MGTYLPRRKDGTRKTPFWNYDFKLKPKGQQQSQRFCGSTGQRTKKAANRVEAKIRELAALGQLNSTMTVAQACDRYWNEKLIYAASADDQATTLETLCTFFGGDTPLMAVTPDMIATAAARRARTPLRRYNRRTDQVEPTKSAILPKLASVNRQIVEPMRRLLKYAKTVLRLPIDLEVFDWGKLSYAEPADRTRELSIEEEVRLWAHLRPDYHPICEMYLISGRRRGDWLGLPKFKVDRTAGTVRFPTRKRKEKGEIVIQLTHRELEIINEEWEKAAACEFVFTYEVRHGPDAGKRRPITVAGLRRATERAFKAAGLDDFRRHDFRHTFASRAGRALGGDLRALQAALDHQDIGSTAKYRHVITSEVTSVRSAVADTVSRNSPGSAVVPFVKSGGKA